MKNLKQFDQFAKGKLNSVKKNNTCVIYTRVSTKEQAENNMSLDTQRSGCENFAKENQYRITAYFGGTYESAKTDERLEFNNMLSFVSKSRDKISYIIVFSVDRFSRSGANAIYIAEQLKQKGINLISVMQPTDVSTPSGALQQNIQFIFSEYDNQLRREKTITGMRNMLLRGDWCTKPPRGYDIVKINSKRSIVINAEGEIIRKAFLWVYYERMSQAAVIDKLFALGVKFGKNSLSSILHNPFYCGILSSRALQGKVVQGNHEKLISQELFLGVNKILTEKRTKGSRWGMDNPELPLKILLRCSDCNEPLTGYEVKKKRIFHYKCGKVGCCNNRSQKNIHDLFRKLLSRIKIDNDNFPSVQKEFLSKFIKVQNLNKNNLKSFSIRLSNVNVKINDIEERFLAREIPENLYLKHSQKLNDEKLKIELEIDKAKAGVYIKDKNKKRSAELLNNLHRMWYFGDLQVKRIIQSSIFPEGLRYNKHIKELIITKLAPGFIISETIAPDFQ
jgi:site-specific DNA recombinase